MTKPENLLHIILTHRKRFEKSLSQITEVKICPRQVIPAEANLALFNVPGYGAMGSGREHWLIN